MGVYDTRGTILGSLLEGDATIGGFLACSGVSTLR